MRKNLAVRRRIGKRVKRLRNSHDLTQEQLAELVGNTWKHIGQIERGQVNVGIDILAAIAQALSVDVAELIGPPSSAASLGDAIADEETSLIDQALHLLQRLKRARR